MTPEATVKAAIKRVLAKMHAWWFMPVQTGYGKTGVPDILACVPYVVLPEDVGKTIGVMVAIEVKAPGKLGNVTPLQQKELDSINAAGGLAFASDSADAVVERISGSRLNPP